MPRLDDGYQTLIDFGGVFGVTIFEKEVQPPGADGGGPVDTTTMRNDFWRTRNAKHLMTLTEMNCTGAYDPLFYASIVGLMLDNVYITVTFPDLSTVSFWGFLDKFMPQPHREGEQPVANFTVVPTNQDDSGNEVAPVYTAP